MWAAQSSAIQGVFPREEHILMGQCIIPLTTHEFPALFPWLSWVATVASPFPHMRDLQYFLSEEEKEELSWIQVVHWTQVKVQSAASRFQGVGRVVFVPQKPKGFWPWLLAPAAAVQLWVTWLQLTGTARAVWSPGLGSQVWSCNEKVTGCRVEMICSSFCWAFLKVMHWIKGTKNNLNGCKKSKMRDDFLTFWLQNLWEYY